jgi:hypothetical protein
MTNQQRLIVAAVFVVAVLGGGALTLLLTRGGDPGATPSPAAQASPSGGSPSALASASLEPSASVETSPGVEPTDGPSEPASPTDAAPDGPTPGPGVPTTVVVTSLKLDAAADPDGVDRRLLFRSQGPGDVTVDLRVTSPQGAATMCLSAGGDKECTAGDRLAASTTRRREDFEVELRGQGAETPVVEVTLTFPAGSPSLRIRDARFDGTEFPETNGIQVLITARDDGVIPLSASWGGHPFAYEIDLLQMDGPGSQVLGNQGPDVSVDETLRVTTGTWRLVLQNIDEGFGVTPLDASIGWP